MDFLHFSRSSIQIFFKIKLEPNLQVGKRHNSKLQQHYQDQHEPLCQMKCVKPIYINLLEQLVEAYCGCAVEDDVNGLCEHLYIFIAQGESRLC